MSDPIHFTQDVEAKLADFGTELTDTVLLGMKTDFRNLSSVFGSLMTLLKNKGVIADDPYQYEDKISEITPISVEQFVEGAKTTVMSIRLHGFERQLKYLNEFYAFSLDHMTLPRLKSLTQFLRFVRWEVFSEGSQDINTRFVAELVGKVRKGDDAMSAGLAKDMPVQMAAMTVKILENLKKVSTFKREEYKLLLRSSFWDALNLAPEEVQGNPDNVQKKIRKEFAGAMKGQPYISELVKELLDEDFAANRDHFRSELLHRIAVTKAVKEKPKVVTDPKTGLMEAVRTLASLNIPFEAGMKKLAENTLLMEEPSHGLGELFQQWLRGLMGIKSRPRVYEIELFDNASNTTRTEEIDFTKFSEDFGGRLRVFVAMANRASPQFAALNAKTEDEILEWFDRNFIESAKSVERMAGLDVFFKLEVPRESKAQVKGIKTEISQVRTTMANANKLKHEYVGRKEEQEQLGRLGIKRGTS